MALPSSLVEPVNILQQKQSKRHQKTKNKEIKSCNANQSNDSSQHFSFLLLFAFRYDELDGVKYQMDPLPCVYAAASSVFQYLSTATTTL